MSAVGHLCRAVTLTRSVLNQTVQAGPKQSSWQSPAQQHLSLAGGDAADTLAQGGNAFGQAFNRAATEGQKSAATAQQAMQEALNNPQVAIGASSCLDNLKSAHCRLHIAGLTLPPQPC